MLYLPLPVVIVFSATQVARCTKIIDEGEDAKYIINVKQIAKFVVGLGEKVAPTDVEEGMRVGYGSLLVLLFQY